MKNAALVSLALAAALPAPAYAELTQAQTAALAAVFARCAEQGEAGDYCDGFRDGLIYLRETSSAADFQPAGQVVWGLPVRPVVDPSGMTVPDMPDAGALPAATDHLGVPLGLPVQNIFPNIEMK